MSSTSIDDTRSWKIWWTSCTWQAYSRVDQRSGRVRSAAPGSASSACQTRAFARKARGSRAARPSLTSRPHSSQGRSSTHVQSLVSGSSSPGGLVIRPSSQTVGRSRQSGLRSASHGGQEGRRAPPGSDAAPSPSRVTPHTVARAGGSSSIRTRPREVVFTSQVPRHPWAPIPLIRPWSRSAATTDSRGAVSRNAHPSRTLSTSSSRTANRLPSGIARTPISTRTRHRSPRELRTSCRRAYVARRVRAPRSGDPRQRLPAEGTAAGDEPDQDGVPVAVDTGYPSAAATRAGEQRERRPVRGPDQVRHEARARAAPAWTRRFSSRAVGMHRPHVQAERPTGECRPGPSAVRVQDRDAGRASATTAAQGPGVARPVGREARRHGQELRLRATRRCGPSSHLAPTRRRRPGRPGVRESGDHETDLTAWTSRSATGCRAARRSRPPGAAGRTAAPVPTAANVRPSGDQAISAQRHTSPCGSRRSATSVTRMPPSASTATSDAVRGPRR